LLGATVLLLIEMYFIVNLPRLYLVQIILGAAILACTYVFIAALLKEIIVIFFVSSVLNWIVKSDRDGLSTLKE